MVKAFVYRRPISCKTINVIPDIIPDPVDPIEPVEPVEPKEPVQPEEPVEPFSPEDPVPETDPLFLA